VVESGRLAGELTVRGIIEAYKRALERSVRRASALPQDARPVEVRVSASSPIAGRTLLEAHLPKDTLLVSVMRDGEMIFPRASTRIETGDLVVIMADPSSERSLRTYLGE
jgi:chloride channel protein, CIC family